MVATLPPGVPARLAQGMGVIVPAALWGYKFMASSVEVAGFRSAGHSVAETCEYFGIKERAVYKACAKVREGGSSAPDDAAQPGPVSRIEQYQAELHEVAGDDTVWTCPYTRLSLPDIPPPVPGTSKAMWLAERRRLMVMPSATVLAPVPTAPLCEAEVVQAAPEALENAVLCEAERPEPAPDLHQMKQDLCQTVQGADAHAPAKQGITITSAPTPRRVTRAASVGSSYTPAGVLLAVIEHGPPIQTWIALMVTALLILACNL